MPTKKPAAKPTTKKPTRKPTTKSARAVASRSRPTPAQQVHEKARLARRADASPDQVRALLDKASTLERCAELAG